MSHIIAIANQKGGVGKTTTCINLGYSLASQLNKRVLLVDIDPQGNCTSGLGIKKESLDKCIYDVLMGQAKANEVIVHSDYANLDVLPATLNLAGAEIELVSAMAREKRLSNALDELKEQYDYFLIDCPPSLSLLTVNALTASNGIIVPIQCEFYALEGLSQLVRVVDMVHEHLNNEVEIIGAVLTMYAKRNLCEQVAEEVKAHFKDLVYDTVICRNVKLAEAPSFGQPVSVYDPKAHGAGAYTELAREVDKREQKRTGKRSLVIHPER